MNKILAFLMTAAIFSSTSVFADDMSMGMDDDSKPCATIAQACLTAGYTRDSTDKRFWRDCMKPVIMGESVSGVTVDKAVVKDCRTGKIQQMKKQIQEFQKVKSN